MPGCDGSWNAFGRLEDRPHNGLENNAVEADARVLRGDSGSGHALFGDVTWCSSVDDTYDNGEHHRGRRSSSSFSSPWGIAGSIVSAWVLTLPAAALIGATFYLCARFLSGG